MHDWLDVMVKCNALHFPCLCLVAILAAAGVARFHVQVGTISVFFYALLTSRAFQINTYGELPGFERAWDPTLSAINW